MTSLILIKSRFLSPARRLLGGLALLAFVSATALLAEDVYVTSYVNDTATDCTSSCPYNLGDNSTLPDCSTACPVVRDACRYGITTNAVWRVTPTLANRNATYKVYVTKCISDTCSPDIIVNMTTTGGTLADINGTPQTAVSTTAFQKANSTNCWTLVGYLANTTTQPDVIFTYASGNPARFYMDAVWFQSVDALPNPASPARITQITSSNNTLTITGTGPLNHPFALLSSTNLAKPLDQWTSEQTNTAGAGTFSFSLTPGAVRASFFRVLSQ